MSLDPKDIHTIDQVRALTREVGALIAAYRKELAEGGMDDTEAWALAQRLEERLLGPVYDAAERELATVTPEPEEYVRLCAAYGSTMGVSDLGTVMERLARLGVARVHLTNDQCVDAAKGTPWDLLTWVYLCGELPPPHDP